MEETKSVQKGIYAFGYKWAWQLLLQKDNKHNKPLN